MVGASARRGRDAQAAQLPSASTRGANKSLRLRAKRVSRGRCAAEAGTIVWSRCCHPWSGRHARTCCRLQTAQHWRATRWGAYHSITLRSWSQWRCACEACTRRRTGSNHWRRRRLQTAFHFIAPCIWADKRLRLEAKRQRRMAYEAGTSGGRSRGAWG